MIHDNKIVSRSITTVAGVLDFLIRTVDLNSFQLRVNASPIIQDVQIPVTYANMHAPRIAQMPNYSKKVTRFQIWGHDQMQREYKLWEEELPPNFKKNIAIDIALCTQEAIQKELK